MNEQPDRDPVSEDSTTGRPGSAPGESGSAPDDTVKRETGLVRDVILFLPRLVALIGKLLLDPAVSPLDKLLLGGVVLYIASPIDILPDIIPVIGQLDDIYLIALSLLRLMNRSGEAKLREHWDGPEDIVEFLYKATDLATRYLPSAVRTAVRGWIESRESTPPPTSG
jgi:uncharacterized membrane protein YkvA (DUF1232 family)